MGQSSVVDGNAGRFHYILLALCEKLLDAGAVSLKIFYPVSTCRVGSDLTSTGFGNDLDNVFMLTRDTRLKDPSNGRGGALLCADRASLA